MPNKVCFYCSKVKPTMEKTITMEEKEIKVDVCEPCLERYFSVPLLKEPIYEFK